MINITNPIFGKLATLSVSRLNTFFSCGIRFRNNYVYEMRPPGGINAIRGKSLHKAIEADNKLYMDDRKRLSLDDMLTIGNECFNSSLIKEGVYIPKSKINDTEKIIEKARQQMLCSLMMYSVMDKPWTPVSVEENVNIDVGYPLPVVAYMDMTDENCCIWDWKTTTKKGNVYEGLQNWIYSKVYEKLYGIRPSFKYCTFILTKEDPKVIIYELPPIKDYAILDRYIEAYLTAIEKEVFLPAGSFDYLCSEAACPFYLTCEFKKGVD